MTTKRTGEPPTLALRRINGELDMTSTRGYFTTFYRGTQQIWTGKNWVDVAAENKYIGAICFRGDVPKALLGMGPIEFHPVPPKHHYKYGKAPLFFK